MQKYVIDRLFFSDSVWDVEIYKIEVGFQSTDELVSSSLAFISLDLDVQVKFEVCNCIYRLVWKNVLN